MCLNLFPQQLCLFFFSSSFTTLGFVLVMGKLCWGRSSPCLLLPEQLHGFSRRCLGGKKNKIKNAFSDRGVKLHSGLMAGEIALEKKKKEQNKPLKVEDCKQQGKVGREAGGEAVCCRLQASRG